MALAAGTRLGAYEILALQGEGGMGEVYRASDTRLDRLVAIKILPSDLAADPVRRERFEREARAAAALNHPNICALYDVGRQNGVEFLVMEYCQGETLAERLAKRSLRLEQALRVAIEIAGAVDAAHSAGFIHRDLKPANIMLTSTGVKLLDFGLARWRAEVVSEAGRTPATHGDSKPRLTAEGAMVGTLNYMAPEQLEGKTVDERTDIFAVGAVMYEMATGRRAFDGQSQASIIAGILERDPPQISSFELPDRVPPAFERLVMKCLAKNPDDRWQTARDLASELKWIADITALAPECSLARRRHQRKAVWAAAATVIAAAVAAAISFVMMPSADPAPTDERPIHFQISPPPGSAALHAGRCASRPALRCGKAATDG